VLGGPFRSGQLSPRWPDVPQPGDDPADAAPALDRDDALSSSNGSKPRCASRGNSGHKSRRDDRWRIDRAQVKFPGISLTIVLPACTAADSRAFH
jgi:hypothetical protein